ncbi:hypothetical protein DITRI_Ditri09bG0086900 [Diplodiscus trichospermus]
MTMSMMGACLFCSQKHLDLSVSVQSFQNGICRPAHCGTDSSTKSAIDYLSWLVSCYGSCKSLGARGQKPFEQILFSNNGNALTVTLQQWSLCNKNSMTFFSSLFCNKQIVFYVFAPALVSSNLAQTITFESFVTLWFMPVNVLITFIIGSALAWLLIKITKPPKHLQGIVIGCCCAGAIYIWSYVYGIMRVYANRSREDDFTLSIQSSEETSETSLGSCREALLPSKDCLGSEEYSGPQLPQTSFAERKKFQPGLIFPEPFCTSSFPFLNIILCITREAAKSTANIGRILFNFASCNLLVWSGTGKMFPYSDSILINISVLKKGFKCIKMTMKKINPRKVFASSAIAGIVRFIIGTVSSIRQVLIGDNAPLQVIDTSACLLGQSTIACMTWIMGANLLRGLKGSDVSAVVITGIIAVKNIFLPLLGIAVVKAAQHFGMISSDPLYQFVLMLQYALPPAMAIGTMTQLLQIGQSECSVIMLWTS